MNKYYDLELNILCCLLLEPSLMDSLIIEDKHFVKYQRIWQFMKSFYDKYKTFNTVLMYNICSEKWQLLKYIEMILDTKEIDSHTSCFDLYQKRLIELYEESKKEKWIKQQIFEVANDLYVGNLELCDFQSKIDEIKENAKKLFKEKEK